MLGIVARILAILLLIAAVPGAAARAQEWGSYGGDPGAQRYSGAAQITKENVGRLALAWTYHTGEAERRGEAFNHSAFQTTPVLSDGKLVFCTPFDRVVALDPASGRELWTFDPELPPGLKPGSLFICRGIAIWHDGAAASRACAARVFLGTNDSRVIALDLATGKRCADFGENGEVLLPADIKERYPGEHQIDSAPAILGDVVIIGSSVDDMTRARAPSGTVFALDARSGKRLWSFDPVPRRADDAAARSWAGESYAQNAGGSVWAPITVDRARDLVFLPTAGPTAAFYGGTRPGDNLYTSSLVALRGSTGAVVWHFQTTHHDIWDYDVAAQPTLATVRRDGREIAAVIVATKMGFVFVLDRETGKPLFSVEERPVPQSDVPGEHTSPTQPFPSAPPPLFPQRLTPDEAWGLAYFDRLACRRRIAALRSDGLYTPPSLKGSILYPSAAGGVNWAGGAFDPRRGLYIVNANRIAHVIRLIPPPDYAAERTAHPDVEIGRALGTPYAAERELLLSPLGVPCNPPPWGTLAAIDVSSGTIRWQVPLGSKFGLIHGVPAIGGPIVTASGLVFIAAAMDGYLRAFDTETGAELWRAALPAGGQATPMTYIADNRQFVVVAAGGHARMGTPLGDSVVAFALPQ